MKDITQQIKDWKECVKACDRVRANQEAGKDLEVDQLYDKVREYFYKYKERFDYNNKPK